MAARTQNGKKYWSFNTSSSNALQEIRRRRNKSNTSKYWSALQASGILYPNGLPTATTTIIS